jgi:hypothetical protein
MTSDCHFVARLPIEELLNITSLTINYVDNWHTTKTMPHYVPS